jgi:fumarate hydratase subunit alpha
MREIEASKITETIARLCQDTNFELGADMVAALKKAEEQEESPLGKEALRQILENAQIAHQELLPLCQDCGTAVIFLEIGQDLHIIGGDINQAVNDGVAKGYTDGYLRKSMVRQPFTARINTKDGSPAVVHTDIVPGDHLKITVMCKGGGAENASRLGMLKSGDGKKGIADFVTKVVEDASGKACPPLIVGVGIGGTTDKVMELAKKALLRPVGTPNSDPEVADLEKTILERVNNLGIGPLGFGGRVTALAVQAEVMPAHIASLPVALNLQCHSARHKEAIL